MQGVFFPVFVGPGLERGEAAGVRADARRPAVRASRGKPVCFMCAPPKKIAAEKSAGQEKRQKKTRQKKRLPVCLFFYIILL